MSDTSPDVCNRVRVTPPPSVCVVGLGHIGLPTAVAFAAAGLDVLGVDVDERTVELVSAGVLPFPEPDLAQVLQESVSDGRLRAATAAAPADVVVLAVPTPLTAARDADLSHVRAAAREVAPHLRRGDLVVLESTVPPGTTARLSRHLAELRPDLTWPHAEGDAADVRVAHCPERVLPGRVMLELVGNDRVVGGVSPACAEAAADLYALFVKGEVRQTDATTAELTKLTENAYRDVNVAFANEVAGICEALGADVHEVVELANRHPRVDVLRPGPGVGGHCIAVDPWFLAASAPGRAPLIRAARGVNDARPGAVVRAVREAAEPWGGRAVVAALGLAYKADVEDLRESPALRVASTLAEELAGRGGAPLLVVEPHVEQLPSPLARAGARLVELDEALRAADVVVLLVDHEQFRHVDPARLAGLAVVDPRGTWRVGRDR